MLSLAKHSGSQGRDSLLGGIAVRGILARSGLYCRVSENKKLYICQGLYAALENMLGIWQFLSRRVAPCVVDLKGY